MRSKIVFACIGWCPCGFDTSDSEVPRRIGQAAPLEAESELRVRIRDQDRTVCSARMAYEARLAGPRTQTEAVLLKYHSVSKMVLTNSSLRQKSYQSTACFPQHPESPFSPILMCFSEPRLPGRVHRGPAVERISILRSEPWGRWRRKCAGPPLEPTAKP
jgi:hypothetical protein